MNKFFCFFSAFLLFIVFACLTTGIYTINTVDYYRVINTFVDISQKPFKPFDPSMSLSAPYKITFDSIESIPYASSFTYLVYLYALISSTLSDTFNLTTLSFIWKGFFIFSIFYLGKCLGFIGKNLFIFASISIVLLSSTSNLSFFESLYQEIVWLFCLPIMTGYLAKKRKKSFDHIIFTASLLIASCSKSQFFYIPTLCVLMLFMLKDCKGKYYILASCAIAQCLSIYCITMSEKATNYNKYHAAYLGAYAIASVNDIKMDGLNPECIGVDSWGNKHDISAGAIPTTIGRHCYEENEKISFKDSLDVYIKHPNLLLKIPFDYGVIDQFKFNYFHVYKRIKLSHGGNFYSNSIDNLKDSIPGILKVLAPLLLTIFVVIKLKDLTPIFIFLSLLFYSQIYVSFLGEGYRDLSKHLFLSNLCFDMMIVLLAITGLKVVATRFMPSPGLKGANSDEIQEERETKTIGP